MAEKKTSLIPAITGDPKRDALLRYAAGAIGGGIVGIAVGYAKSKGWWVPDDDTLKLITQVIGGTVVVVMVTRWGTQAVDKSEAAVAANTVAAAVTGQVPEAIIAKATPEQVKAVEESPRATVVAGPAAAPGSTPPA